MDYCKSKLKSKRRLSIPEFSGFYFALFNNCKQIFLFNFQWTILNLKLHESNSRLTIPEFSGY